MICIISRKADIAMVCCDGIYDSARLEYFDNREVFNEYLDGLGKSRQCHGKPAMCIARMKGEKENR